jgi:hypothetical protein
MTTVTTPWGKATSVEVVSVPQRSGDKRFTTRVELLATRGGERLVRFSYAADGTGRRGPVTLRERDLAKLRIALERTSELGRLLGYGGAPGSGD